MEDVRISTAKVQSSSPTAAGRCVTGVLLYHNHPAGEAEMDVLSRLVVLLRAVDLHPSGM